MKDGPVGTFRVEFTIRSKPSGGLTLPGAKYADVLRRVSQEILGGTGERATVYLGSDRVAEAYLQDSGRKFSVKIVGEKPRKGKTKSSRSSQRHELSAGRLCTWGPDGICTGCGVAMGDCHACGGIGYHEPGCPESDETIEESVSGNQKTRAQIEGEIRSDLMLGSARK